MTPLIPTTLAALLALAACGDSAGSGIGPPSPGGFGQASLTPDCGAFNQACLATGLDTPLAVGTQLGLGISLEIPGNSALPTTLSSSNPQILGISLGVATSLREGVSAILISGPDEEVLDFIHVWSVPANTLRIVSYTDNGIPLGPARNMGSLLPGDELLVAVEALADSQPLIGQFQAEWTIEVLDDPGTAEDGPIVSILDDVVFGLYRLVARRPGTVRLRSTALNTNTELELEVLP